MTVSWFATKAASDGTDFQFTGNVAPKSQESNSALVAVFANILSNAYEACSRAAKPYIKIETGAHCDAVVISCRNSFDGVLKYGDDGKLMTRKEGSGHGMGLKSVYNIAEKSGGYVEIRNTPDEFIINAVINTSVQ